MAVQGLSKKRSPSRATMAHRAALISASIALSQTPAYAARPRIRIQDGGLYSLSARWFGTGYGDTDTGYGASASRGVCLPL